VSSPSEAQHQHEEKVYCQQGLKSHRFIERNRLRVSPVNASDVYQDLWNLDREHRDHQMQMLDETSVGTRICPHLKRTGGSAQFLPCGFPTSADN
jgi:hypothetical protein